MTTKLYLDITYFARSHADFADLYALLRSDKADALRGPRADRHVGFGKMLRLDRFSRRQFNGRT